MIYNKVGACDIAEPTFISKMKYGIMKHTHSPQLMNNLVVMCNIMCKENMINQNYFAPVSCKEVISFGTDNNCDNMTAVDISIGWAMGDILEQLSIMDTISLGKQTVSYNTL